MSDIKRIALDQEPLWGIQFDETVAQYRAFCLYRDLLDGRSLSKVAEALAREKAPEAQRDSKAKATKSEYLPGHLAKWSATNRWVERADAYDLHLEQQRRLARETEITRMEQRERTLANVAISGVMRRVMGYEDPEDPTKNVEQMDWSKLTPSEVAQLAKTFVEISRLATNRPTSLVRNSMMIQPKDYEDVVNGLIELFLRHVPAERRAVAAEQASAFLARGGL